jgi:outer membrane translocation and assembly module TamA
MIGLGCHAKARLAILNAAKIAIPDGDCALSSARPLPGCLPNDIGYQDDIVAMPGHAGFSHLPPEDPIGSSAMSAKTSAARHKALPLLAHHAHRVVYLVKALALLVLLALTGCAHQKRPEKVPGETDLTVRSVEVVADPSQPEPESVDMTPLYGKLGSRAASALYTARYYNPFRVAEDRRRIESYLQTLGYLDAVAGEPELSINEARKDVKLRFLYNAGPRYVLSALDFHQLPEGLSLKSFERAAPGDTFDFEVLRVVRYDMAAHLQRAGYGHAQVYVRFYVDKGKKTVAVRYFCDAGPKTKVGSIRVQGARSVAEADVRERMGLLPGDTFSLAAKERAEVLLYNTGAFAHVTLVTTADVESYLGDVPDTGGVLAPERINAEGDLIPRALSDSIDVVAQVDEAPAVRLRLRASAEVDPTRFDTVLGAGTELRNVFGSQHHLSLKGRIGAGTFFRNRTADVGNSGILYGDALLRYSRPGLLGQLVDGRVSVRFREAQYPGFRLRELTAGPGLWIAPSKNLFVEAETNFRLAGTLGLGPFSEQDRLAAALPADSIYRGLELNAAIVWDERNDPVEATRGHLMALRALASPVGTNTYVQLAPELRAFIPLGSNFSLALRGVGAWVFGNDVRGVPVGPRLFGGGAYGMRGFGREQLSPLLTTCNAQGCGQERVGGLSMVESSIELRFLPELKQFGFNTFVDLGGFGLNANPFSSGLMMAAGIGPRIRLWYLPISIDLAYRFLEGSRLANGGLQLFARIGEAY